MEPGKGEEVRMDVGTMNRYLAQAGCTAETRAHVCRLVESGHGGEGLPELAEQRMRLVRELHEADRRLVCLDSVIASIKGTTRA